MAEIVSIKAPFEVFRDTDGQPLDAGYIYIGVENLEPTQNPVAIYWDEALLIPAVQPLRTMNGYLSRNGSPAVVYSNAAIYSILVQDKRGGLVYSSPSTDGAPVATQNVRTDLITNAANMGADMVAYDPSFPYQVGTVGKELLAVDKGLVDITAAYQAADLTFDAVVRTDFKAADAIVTTAFKAADTALASRISAVEVGQSYSIVAYDTQAHLYSDLTPDDASVGYVMNDSTPAKNGTYRKSGASGTGSWIQSTYDRVALVETKTNSIALAHGLNLPFADSLSNDFIRKLVRDVKVYGADVSHTYIISQIFIDPTFCRFTIRDITASVDVGQSTVSRAIPDYTTLPRWWKVYATDYSVYTVLDIDWTQAIAGSYIYTTVAQSGIHPNNVFNDEMIADYLYKDQWHEIIRVGAGETYTTINAAMATLTDEANLILIQGCGRSCYHHQILIDLVDATTYPVKNANFPEFVSLRGRGRNKTFINSLDTSAYALLQMHRETKILDCTVLSDTGDGGVYYGEYCVHSDDVNQVSMAQKTRRLKQLVKRVALTGGVNQAQWLWGCGISGGQTIRFEDVTAGHLNTGSAASTFGFHNTSGGGTRPSYLPSIVEMLGCRSNDEKGAAVSLVSLGGGNRCTLSLLGNNHVNFIQQSVTGAVADRAVDRYEWEVGGVYDGAISYQDSDMKVLATTIGQTPSGTAAPLIFGTMDELGRGDKSISDGSTNTGKSLGARLGDCSSVNKTLTIGAQTKTFNTNLTGSSNATIIAAINAVITTYPVSEKNIQFEVYPDIGFTRRMLNSTGSTIAAGKFVKRTGVNTIALADGTDDVYGFVCRDIRNGYTGNIVTSKCVYKDYITGATTDGKFGVTSGALDYLAATKIGYVNNGIVTRY